MKIQTAATWVIVASIVIIILWILALKSNLPRRIKAIITSAVIISPIPPFP